MIAKAPRLLGYGRHLGLVPEQAGQERRQWDGVVDLGADPWLSTDQPVVVLASGDPLVSGIGSALVDSFGECVRIHPALSSVALARARMGWRAETTTVVTVVGRRHEAVLRHLAPGHRLLVLTSDASSPDVVAALLRDAGYERSRMTVLGDLGAASESRLEGRAGDWSHTSPALHVLALELDGPSVAGWTAGLPDDAFEHDGQLTKRDVRASALARLAPQPGQVLWDVGAGAGSIGIEWMRAHATCSAVAFERHPDRRARIARNAARLGVPGLEVAGDAATLFDVGCAHPAPHAVFVGGGATTPGLIDLCRDRLLPGGRLVVHGVTLETERLLLDAYATHGGELTRIAVETTAPIGTFTGRTPARAVTQWCWTKAEEGR